MVLKSLCVFLRRWRIGGSILLLELNVERNDVWDGIMFSGMGGVLEKEKKFKFLGILSTI